MVRHLFVLCFNSFAPVTHTHPALIWNNETAPQQFGLCAASLSPLPERAEFKTYLVVHIFADQAVICILNTSSDRVPQH
jgi:hypothetical protein